MADTDPDAQLMQQVLDVLRDIGRPTSEEVVAQRLKLRESEAGRLLYRLSLRGLVRLSGSFGRQHSGGHGYTPDYGKGLWSVVEPEAT